MGGSEAGKIVSKGNLTRWVRRSVPALIIIILLVGISAACASSRQNAPEVPLPNQPKEESWEITDRQETAGGTIPEWVGSYIEGGLRAIEALPEFAGRYAFVSEEEGVSFSALQRRLKAFDPGLDFPQLAALRIQQRLSILGGTNPDREFSRYLESVVRAAADSAWPGAIKQDDFWLQKTSADETAETETRETYLFLILITVEQEYFRGALDGILLQPSETHESGRERGALARRIRNTFFDNF
jgi:hypothetical protein